MSKRLLIGFLLGCLLAGGVAWQWIDARSVAAGNWGIDAGLTRHASSLERFGYKYRLAGSGVGTIRERDIGRIAGTPENPGAWSSDVRPQFRDLAHRGYQVAAFAQLPFKPTRPQPGNQLPEDLLAVHRQARFMGREFAGVVQAWEMVGEPDIGFCRDLPDRVAAYQKALYLGLKAGSREAEENAKGLQSNSGFRSQVSGFSQSPIVLMGALGMPPGPWLERFAANDGLDYTDAYNFHFYGHAVHLTGVIEAHREAIRRLLADSCLLSGNTPNNQQPTTHNHRQAGSLPMWITEAGIEAVDKKDFLNAQRRQLQAEFTLSTAKQALAAEDVAVFMPFILAYRGDPYAMSLSSWRTLPAWDVYAKFTRENPWPQRALSRKPKAVSPVVIQWLPDNATCVPHKAAGTYRFWNGKPIKGELRVYNFSAMPAVGRIRISELKFAAASLKPETGDLKPEEEMTIPPMGMRSVAVELKATASRYFRETCTVSFQLEDTQVSGLRSQVSKASFGLESWARIEDFTEEPLPLRALPESKIRFPQMEPYAPGERVGVWTTINGLRAAVQKPETGNLKPETSSTAEFWIEKENTDPLAPAMAVAAINGFPAIEAGSREQEARSQATFLRLQLDKPMTRDRKVLVVLVDDRGQRYSIWENFGADYYKPSNDVWLNLEDIHADFWGAMSSDYRFRPERVREVHLRLYLDTPGDKVGVTLSLLKAKL